MTERRTATGAGIRLEAVSYRYAGAREPVLIGIDVRVEPGRVLGVAGATESGKSTLCLVAAGVAPVVVGGTLEGIVRLGDRPTAGQRAHELAQRCGLLTQDAQAQLSGTTLTVFEEVAFGPRNLGLSVAEIVDRVDRSLALLGIEALASRAPDRLSGGQAQLVALASVLAMRPGALVLDEPTSQLDPEGTRLVGAALARLADDEGVAIILVEHKTELLARLADEIAVLDGGRLARLGPAHEILADADLTTLGVEPPPAVRLRRAFSSVGLALPPAAEAILAEARA